MTGRRPNSYPPAAIRYLAEAWPGGVPYATLVAEFSRLAGRPMTRSMIDKQRWKLGLMRPEGYRDPGQGRQKGKGACSTPRCGHATTARPCLLCRKPFPSEGAHHRLCDLCNKGIADGHIVDEAEPYGIGSVASRSSRTLRRAA